jgi:hypothetical protein
MLAVGSLCAFLLRVWVTKFDKEINMIWEYERVRERERERESEVTEEWEDSKLISGNGRVDLFYHGFC